MMTLAGISQLTQQVEQALALTKNLMSNETLMSWFTDDFAVRFCWSSGALEGNTLSLEEIIALIEYDEVRAGHTYTEYQEAKNLFRAIQESMLPFSPSLSPKNAFKKVTASSAEPTAHTAPFHCVSAHNLRRSTSRPRPNRCLHSCKPTWKRSILPPKPLPRSSS